MRQERIRKEHPASEAAKHEGVPCTHEEMFEAAQEEAKQHSAISADAWMRLRSQDDELHRIAQEKGAGRR